MRSQNVLQSIAKTIDLMAEIDDAVLAMANLVGLPQGHVWRPRRTSCISLSRITKQSGISIGRQSRITTCYDRHETDGTHQVRNPCREPPDVNLDQPIDRPRRWWRALPPQYPRQSLSAVAVQKCSPNGLRHAVPATRAGGSSARTGNARGRHMIYLIRRRRERHESRFNALHV